MEETPIIGQVAEDRKLIDSLRQGNEFVLKRLYKDHFHSIKKMILNNSGDEDDAKDVYQEAFIVFYDQIRKPDFELKASISTYLYSVSRNIWLKKLRSYTRSPEVAISDKHTEEELSEEEQDEINEKEKWIESLEIALNKLGEPCRSVLTDFFYHKKSMEEIAAKFNYTNADTAKTQKYKCFNRLKKLVLLNNRKE